MTIILAKILGLYFLALGLAFISNGQKFKDVYRQIVNDPNFLFLGGVIALLIGAVIVSIHNVWVYDWPVIITILGWWSVLKGYLLLIYPDSIKLFSFMENRSNAFYRIVSLFYIIFGLFLLYKGFLS